MAPAATEAPDAAWLEATLASVLHHATSLVERFPKLADDWPEDRRGGHHDKLIGEAAMLLLGASRVRGGKIANAVATLADAIAAQMESGRLQALLMRSRRNRSAALFPAIVLGLVGRPVPSIQRLLTSGKTIPENEAVPFRLAERQWIRFLAEGAPLPADPFVPGSIFDGDPNVLEMDRTDLYAITHWAAYATDMGAARAPVAFRRFVATRLDGAIAWQLAEQDFDLLGEVLMAARMLRLPETRGVGLAWAVMRAAWDELGFLPSPSFHLPDFEALDGTAREAYVAAHTYHTNFVLGLLCAAELSVPGVESIGIEEPLPTIAATEEAEMAVEQAGDYFNPALLEGVAGIAPRETEPAFWQRAIAGKPGADLLVLEARLIRTARTYDLADLASSLEAWIGRSMPLNRAFVEAVRFLARQQVPEGAIGAHFLEPDNLRGPQAVLITSTLARLLGQCATYLRAASARAPSDEASFHERIAS